MQIFTLECWAQRVGLFYQIVEFIAVMLKSGNEAAGKELASSGTIKRTLELFFE